MIKHDSKHLLIKISSPKTIDFFNEHNKIINTHGYVWLCRFGKSNLIVENINKDGNLIFIKESKANGNREFVAFFNCISTNREEVDLYPDYYDGIEVKKELWFKVTKIIPLDSALNDFFTLSSSGGPLESGYRSMCNTFYITCKKDMPINKK